MKPFKETFIFEGIKLTKEAINEFRESNNKRSDIILFIVVNIIYGFILTSPIKDSILFLFGRTAMTHIEEYHYDENDNVTYKFYVEGQKYTFVDENVGGNTFVSFLYKFPHYRETHNTISLFSFSTDKSLLFFVLEWIIEMSLLLIITMVILRKNKFIQELIYS